MILLDKGFEYKGFKLGQIVKLKKSGELHRVIGFNLNSTDDYYITINSNIGTHTLQHSSYINTMVCLNGCESCCGFDWVKPSEIEIVDKDSKDIKIGKGLVVTPNPTINVDIISNDSKKEGYEKCLQMAEQLKQFEDKNRFVITIDDTEWFVEITEDVFSKYSNEDRIIKSNRKSLMRIISFILYDKS